MMKRRVLLVGLPGVAVSHYIVPSASAKFKCSVVCVIICTLVPYQVVPKSQQVKYNICYTCYTFHINSILNIGPTSMHTIQSTKSEKKLSRRKEKKRQKNDIRCHQVDVRGYCQAYDED